MNYQFNIFYMKSTNNKSFLVTLLAIFLISSVTFASFPVRKEVQTQQITKSEQKTEVNLAKVDFKQSFEKKDVKSSDTMAPKAMDEKLILILLWLFLGAFAAHRWYKGKPVLANILYIITGGGLGIWAIIDLIKIITDKF